MNLPTNWTDAELGPIHVKPNQRARRIILKVRPEAIVVTVPPGIDEAEIARCLETYRPKLLALRKQNTSRHIDLNYRLDSGLVCLTLHETASPRFSIRSTPERIEIGCPANTRFDDENVQQWLQKVIEEALRKSAKALLPGRLKRWSDQWNLPYRQVRINSSKSRWGSCSTHKHINLSFYIVLLPPHLADYVLLHELAHTLEMNHSDRFWQLLNQITDNKALLLRQELKKYRTSVV